FYSGKLFNDLQVVLIVRSELQVSVDRPNHVGTTLKYSINACCIFIQLLFALFSFDGQCNLPRNKLQKFKVPAVVRVGTGIRFYSDDTGNSVSDSQPNTNHDFRCDSVEIETVGTR